MPDPAPLDLRRIIPSQEDLEMGRPKHTLPSVLPTGNKTKQSPKWWFRAQVSVLRDGTRERETRPYYVPSHITGKREADRYRDEVCAKLNYIPGVIRAQTLFAAVLDAYMESEGNANRKSTRENYERQIRLHITPALGDKRLCDITPQEVQLLVNRMGSKGYQIKTQKVVTAVIHLAWEWAAEQGYVETRNPVTRRLKYPDPEETMKARQQRRAPSIAEYRRIYALLPAEYRLAADVMAFCGLRVGEAAALLPEHCDHARGVIVVREQIYRDGRRGPTKRKGAKRKVLEVPMGFLAPRLRSFAMPGRRKIECQMIGAFHAAGLTFGGAGAHCLRRFYATHASSLLERADVQGNLGHATLEMTAHYIDDPSIERRREAMDRMAFEVFGGGEGAVN